MSAADGQVIAAVKIVDHGSPADRFNLVIVSEGYREDELLRFSADSQDFARRLFSTPPFDELQCAFNVYRIDVASTESGADDPAGCGGTGAAPATYFDASFCGSGIQRLLLVDTGMVMNVANAHMPQWHQILVIVNSPIWGGAGGSIGTTSTAPGWENIAIHELGHAVFGLADEYEFWEGCALDTDRDTYPGGEPSEPNVTIDGSSATIKWADLIPPSTPIPTTRNADCTLCDPQSSPVSAGTVGAFEGARYYHCGIYRPEFDCMMRNLRPFCAVCKRRIRATLAPYMSRCYAPEFEGSRGLMCLFTIIACALAVAALIWLAWIPGIMCAIKGLLFRIRNCSKGNRDRCIGL